MTIHFQKNLPQALMNINFQEYHELPVHQETSLVCPTANKKVIDLYGEQMWKVVDLINEKFGRGEKVGNQPPNEEKHSRVMKEKFDLYNWINHNSNDEVAYFLSETGSNCINFSEFKAPAKFHLWLGVKGFVIGVEQKGKPFNAEEIDPKRIKDNEGAAFEFYRQCESAVFFDNYQAARVVYLEWLF